MHIDFKGLFVRFRFLSVCYLPHYYRIVISFYCTGYIPNIQFTKTKTFKIK